VALADPTPANLAAVRTFADGAEAYFDPALAPNGGYAWYRGETTPIRAYFDDNGWWEIAFLDAYRATHDTRYVTDAEKAFDYIAQAGWDPANGGVWWETLHYHKTSEPLAAEIYAGVVLYEITRQSQYLTTAQQYLAWADAHSWNTSAQLYSRSDTDPTVLDYVEGMMIGAHLELCRATGDRQDCAKAEQLAAASMRAFPRLADWTPAADVVYLRFLVDLYRVDHNPRWYDVVRDNAQAALAHGRGRNGLFVKHWDGRGFPDGLLQVQGATSSLFAWLAYAATPSG